MADTSNHLIRMINFTDMTVSTIAGQPGKAGWSPDGPAGASLLSQPWALAAGPASGTMPVDVFWSESGTGIIRRYNGATVSTYAGTPRGFGFVNGPALGAKFAAGGPQGIAFFGNDLFIVDTNNHVIRKLDSSTGSISTYAGISGSYSPMTNGPLASATFNQPAGITIDSAGQLYIADWGNSVIRLVTSTSVSTLAGITTPGYVDGLSSSAQFNRPQVRSMISHLHNCLWLEIKI